MTELLSERVMSVYTDLLQTENECLCTLNLVNLPSFTHGLLDDVTIIVVILQKKKKSTTET